MSRSIPSVLAIMFLLSAGQMAGASTEIMNATLPAPRSRLACAADPVAGKIYCFGGRNPSVLSQTIGYEPGAFGVTTGVMPSPRQRLSCATRGDTGEIYCFGGHDGSTYVDDIWMYDTSDDAFTVMDATLPTPRDGMACATDPATGKIYCFGGYDGSTYLDEIVEYDPATDTVGTSVVTLCSGVSRLACVAHPATGNIYCFGGRTQASSRLRDMAWYDPGVLSVTCASNVLPRAQADWACSAVDATEKIYCTGGYLYDEILEYDPGTDTFVTMSDVLPSVRRELACATDPATGKIYCFGGYDGSTYLDEIVEYDPHLCGDGFVGGSDQCDDGNTTDGDCCSSTCQFELNGNSCDDGNPETSPDTCDGIGECVPVELMQFGVE